MSFNAQTNKPEASNHEFSAVSKPQVGNGLGRISAGMVEILLHSYKQGRVPANYDQLGGSLRPFLMLMRARQQKINDSEQHQHESIDKEQTISQYEDVAEKYGSHPHDRQSRSKSRCLWDQKQSCYHCLEDS